ncbi:MAG: enoyl-CoA hydratase-related protein [Bacteroidetes bacterium]|nr:enoyl-CoA hydratase-related protein [Bacteroidota bacterium]
MTQNILTKLVSGKLVITINRPEKMNALNHVTLSELEGIIKSVYKDPDIRGAIITGSGNKAFIAGADIAEFIGLTPTKAKELSINGQRVLEFIENSPKPIIAAVNGYALGGGCEIAMACHLRIASNNAIFGQPEVKLGIIPGYGGTQRLIQYIGKSLAMELMLTAETIDAEKAQKIGLVNFVTSSESLIDKSQELLDKILSKPPIAIAGVINSVNGFFREGINGYKVENEEFEKCFLHKDFHEGINAFLEKRKPKFG